MWNTVQMDLPGMRAWCDVSARWGEPLIIRVYFEIVYCGGAGQDCGVSWVEMVEQ